MKVSNKKKDGFYVYLDIDEIKMEDYSFSNSTENTSSTIKAVKIKTQIFNIFSNNYKDQLLNIYFDIRNNLKYTFKRRTAPFMLLSKAFFEASSLCNASTVSWYCFFCFSVKAETLKFLEIQPWQI